MPSKTTINWLFNDAIYSLLVLIEKLAFFSQHLYGFIISLKCGWKSFFTPLFMSYIKLRMHLIFQLRIIDYSVAGKNLRQPSCCTLIVFKFEFKFNIVFKFKIHFHKLLFLVNLSCEHFLSEGDIRVLNSVSRTHNRLVKLLNYFYKMERTCKQLQAMGYF